MEVTFQETIYVYHAPKIFRYFYGWQYEISAIQQLFCLLIW